MGIHENIRAREAAELLVELMLLEHAGHRDASKAFWTAIVAGIPDQYLPVQPHPAVAPMVENEAKIFERQVYPFKKHAGKPVADVPLDDLFWLDCQTDFRADLRRYLLSDRVQREQR